MANIALDTNKPNLDNNDTGWNLFTTPKNNELFGKGNNTLWAQFYINKDKDNNSYHIITSHDVLNTDLQFGRYVGVINNKIDTNLSNSDDTEWLITAQYDLPTDQSFPIFKNINKQIRVFASGSCRLLTTLSRMKNCNINCVHTMDQNFTGTNFLGKLHTTKQHIQLLEYLRNEIVIPDINRSYFLTTSNKTRLPMIDRSNPVQSKKVLSVEINNCDVFMFEVSSIKNFKYNETYLNIEFLDDNIKYTESTMEYNEILNDIILLSNYVKKPIIFLCNFRPQIYGKDIIQNREIIYNACKDGAKQTGNYFYDPSEIVKTYGYNSVLDDEYHWNRAGFELHSEYISRLLFS